MDKVFTFDIETHKEVPEGADWIDHRPLGIANIAASVQTNKGDLSQWLWYRGMDEDVTLKGVYPLYESNNIATPSNEAMTPAHVSSFVRTALDFMKLGYKVVGWNSAGFDWQVISDHISRAENELELLKGVVRNHFDPMFQFVCAYGYPVGLNTVSQAMAVGHKTEGMKGDIAPVMWQGNEEERRKVLKYVLQDSYLTLQVYNVIERLGYIAWTSKKGRSMSKPLPKMFPVKECVKITLPDTSWMSSPIPRSKFVGWLD